MLTAQDIVNYYAANKPFEITDDTQYLSMLQNVAQMTIIEFSENEPILEEKEITSPASTAGNYVEIDLYTDIDENFMSFVLFELKDQIELTTNRLISTYLGSPQELPAIRRALDGGSLLEFLAVRDSLYAMEDWFYLKSRKLIYNNSKIKVLPETDYYCLYKRYRNLDEIPPSAVNSFKKLLLLNLLLSSYQSDIYASEAGIRSVSISSLSVSFNVSSAKDVTDALLKEKEKLMGELAMVYDEDMVGII